MRNVFSAIRHLRFAIIFFAFFFFSLKNSSAQQSTADLIHIGDRIEIDVVGSLDFDWRGVVGTDGYLEDFDKIADPVYARCLKTDDLASKIEIALSRILREPKVIIRILDRGGRPPALIVGAVKQPQRLILKRSANLREIIVVSGGITDKASGKIVVFRPPGLGCGDAADMPKTQTIDITELIAGKQEANPEILPGDIVTVVSANPVYVIGGVAAPGIVLFRSEMTLSRAIASAGGLTKDAKNSSATIYRREEGKQTIIEADLRPILDKKQQDLPLKPYDIIEIGEKGGPKKRILDYGLPFTDVPASSLPVRVID